MKTPLQQAIEIVEEIQDSHKGEHEIWNTLQRVVNLMVAIEPVESEPDTQVVEVTGCGECPFLRIWEVRNGATTLIMITKPI